MIPKNNQHCYQGVNCFLQKYLSKKEAVIEPTDTSTTSWTVTDKGGQASPCSSLHRDLKRAKQFLPTSILT